VHGRDARVQIHRRFSHYQHFGQKILLQSQGWLGVWIAVYDGDYGDILSDEEHLAIKIDTIHVLAVCSGEEDSFEEHPV
jgi:hypothetical protein